MVGFHPAALGLAVQPGVTIVLPLLVESWLFAPAVIFCS